jgi:large subunit ribosomal protein L6
MSRVGKAPISIPTGTVVTITPGLVTAKGPKGELSQDIPVTFEVKVEEGVMTIHRPSDSKQDKSLHGLYRSLLNNLITGVSQGHSVNQELVGVGYKVSNQGNLVEFVVGYSHKILLQIPSEITVVTETVKGKNPNITMSCCDKQLLGQLAAKIRSFRTPEPYKGKGIRFAGEVVRRKAGKSAGKK